MKLFLVACHSDNSTFPTEWYTSLKDAGNRQRSLLRQYGDYSGFYVTEATYGYKVLSVTQVAEFFNVPRNTVLNWIKAGNIQAFRIGHKWMIKAESLPSFNE